MASLAACMDGIDQPDAHFRISYMDIIVCIVLNGAVEFVDQDAMRSAKIELGTGKLLILAQLGAHAICIDPEQASSSIRKEAFSQATLIWTLSLV